VSELSTSRSFQENTKEKIIIYLIDLFQPPSILPISWIDSCNRRYFLLSKQCMSLANLRRIFNKSKETIAFSRCNNFWSCLEIPVAIDDSKIGTGLTDEQWKELNRRTRKIATGKKPDSYVLDKNLNPDTWVKPFLVVEILADEITKSPIHTAGLALRFPRLVRFRDDKKAEDTNNLEELKKLFEMQKV